MFYETLFKGKERKGKGKERKGREGKERKGKAQDPSAFEFRKMVMQHVAVI